MLTYSKTSENKLNQSYETLKKLKTNVKKAEELQGSTKIKKITVKDFKNETPKKKQVFKNDNNNYQLSPYERRINDKGDDVYYRFIFYNPTEELLQEISEDYLKFKNYKLGANKDYAPIERTEHTRKKHLYIVLMVTFKKHYQLCYLIYTNNKSLHLN